MAPDGAGGAGADGTDPSRGAGEMAETHGKAWRGRGGGKGEDAWLPSLGHFLCSGDGPPIFYFLFIILVGGWGDPYVWCNVIL